MYVTLKFFDFKKKMIHLSPTVPHCLMLWSKSLFLYLFLENLYFCGKNIIHQQQCAQMCRGMAFKPGGNKVQLVRRAYMPTIHRYVLICRVSAH